VREEGTQRKTLAIGTPEMKLNRLAVSTCGLMFILASAASAAGAGGLPAGVQQKVGQTVGAWVTSGNADAAGAAIADLCAANPGIAIDIVAYAGEKAAKSSAPQQCLVSKSDCPALEDLLGVLYEHAINVSGGSPVVTVPVKKPDKDNNQAGDGDPRSPCQISGTCGGEGPSVSETGI
jgi:hypothetical protein